MYTGNQNDDLASFCRLCPLRRCGLPSPSALKQPGLLPLTLKSHIRPEPGGVSETSCFWRYKNVGSAHFSHSSLCPQVLLGCFELQVTEAMTQTATFSHAAGSQDRGMHPTAQCLGDLGLVVPLGVTGMGAMVRIFLLRSQGWQWRLNLCTALFPHSTCLYENHLPQPWHGRPCHPDEDKDSLWTEDRCQGNPIFL